MKIPLLILFSSWVLANIASGQGVVGDVVIPQRNTTSTFLPATVNGPANPGKVLGFDANGALVAIVGGDVATDKIFNAKGDLVAGTGADASARLPLGLNNYILTADSTQTTGLKWAVAPSVATDPLWAAAGDLVVGTANDTAAILPKGIALQMLRVNSGATALEWATVPIPGDIFGPASATDNAVVRFDTTTGKLVQNSGLLVGDSAAPALVATTPATAAGEFLSMTAPTGGNTSIATTGVGGIGGTVTIASGVGGMAYGALTAATGGAGGAINVNGAIGGTMNVPGTGTNTGGAGSAINLSSGTGGGAWGASSGTNTGGAGGGLILLAGNGGYANSSTGANVSGAGGQVAISAGSGGAGATGGNGGQAALLGGIGGATIGGAGGLAQLRGGAGSVTGSGGAGGAASIVAGNAGGDNTVDRTGGSVSIIAGNSKGNAVGGAAALTAGIGGSGTGATGVTGGAVYLSGGSGGAGSTTGGLGGDAWVRAGSGGDSTTDGVGGGIYFQTASTLTLTNRMSITAAGNVGVLNGSTFSVGLNGAQASSIYSIAAAINFGSMAAGAEDTQTITLANAATTNTPSVELGWASALEAGIVVSQAWVSGANTVSIRVKNTSAGVVDPASLTVRATVTQF